MKENLREKLAKLVSKESWNDDDYRHAESLLATCIGSFAANLIPRVCYMGVFNQLLTHFAEYGKEVRAMEDAVLFTKLHLEKSEGPFYAGMKMLNEIAEKIKR